MRLILFWLLLAVAGGAFGAQLYEFANIQQQQRFENLTRQLRCVECEHQSIAESFSLLSQDMKTVIYQQIQQGKTDREIIDYLQSRYGESILSAPQHQILWLLPILFIGLLLGWQILNAKKK